MDDIQIRSSVKAKWVLVLWVVQCFGFAQDEVLRFQQIGPEEGLSHQTVTSVFQDRLGFMWFGTIDGLNRFDGYSCVTYQHNAEDPTSISSSFIHGMVEDGEGNLWIGTRDGGLSILTPEGRAAGKFRRLWPFDKEQPGPQERRVELLFCDSKNRIWVGSQNALSRYDRESETFVVYNFFADVDGDVMVMGMVEDDHGWLWMSTTMGLFRVNFAELETLDPAACSHSVQRFSHNPEDPESLAPGWSYLMFLDRDNRLWLGSRTSGISLFNPQTGKVKHFRHDPDNPDSIAKNYAAVQFQDAQGRLWLSTDGGGINIFDPQTGKFTSHLNEPNRSDSLSHNQVTRIFQSRDGENGTLWVATWGGGVNKLLPSEKPFEVMRHDPGNPNSLSFNFILAVTEDHFGNLWVGTGSGLNRWDPIQRSWQRFVANPNETPSLSNNTVWCLLAAQNGDLWVGVEHGSLNQLKLSAEGSVNFVNHEHRPENPRGIAENNVKAVYQDREGFIWLGYENAGLSRSMNSSGDPDGWLHARHNPNDSTSVNHNTVRCFLQDSQGRLWVGTLQGGLSQLTGFSPQGIPQFTSFGIDPQDPAQLGSADIRAITETRDGAIWLATYGGGANRLDPATGQFTRLTTREGLANDFVYAILEDSEGDLWISTNRGIDQYNPATKSFAHFGTQHGLQSDEFNTGAYHQSENGTLYFGGVNGLNRFHPQELRQALLRDQAFAPPVVLTRFVKMGQSVPLFLKANALQPVRLAHDDKYFAFEMATLDYHNPRKNRFRYQLEGFSDTWIDNENRNFASFTNLDPGTYRLRYQGANHTGIWYEGTPLAIVVEKPFWQTWWFRGLILLALGLLVLLGVKFRQVYLAYRSVKFIAHFKILKTLGKGGAGTVYLAWDRFSKKRLALKVLHPDLEEAHDGVRRFLQEAEIGSRLNHPNIVRITEAGTHGQTRYLCMEYLEGQTLKDLILAEGALSEAQVLDFGAQILRGLAAIHEQGIVHRDLKSANLMVLPDGCLKIMDFGLARVSSLTTVENRGQLMGTLAYMSPEQTLGKGVDVRADIYSFGSILHEMLFGTLPFSAANEMELIYAIHNEQPLSLKKRDPATLKPLECILARCLAKDPAERFNSVAELQQAWQKVSGSDPGTNLP